MNDDSASTFDVLQFIRASWKRSAVGALLGLAAGLVYAFVAPKWYKAELSVVPSVSPKGGTGALLSSAVSALGVADLPFDVGGGGADVDRIDALFHSRSVSDRVIAKFNLVARYDLKYLEDARDTLWNLCATKIDKKGNLVTLSCEDKVPDMARTMAAYIADEANQVARRTSTSSAGEERQFLEKRVAQAKDDLDQASRKLRQFQEQNKIISLPDQAKAVVTSMATLRAEMLDKQMQLAFVDGFASSDESTSSQLRRQVGILEHKLKSLQEAKSPIDSPAQDPSSSPKQPKADSHDTGGLFPPAMNIPKLQYEVEDLLREQKIQQTLLSLLTERYEIARVNEARDTSTFQILDNPVVPTKKSRPKRMIIAAIACLMGCLVGIVMTMISLTRVAAASADAKQT